MEVRRAGPGELGVVLEILEQAREFQWAHGPSGWEPGQFRDEIASGGRLAQAFEHGDVYVAREGGRVVATVTLQWEDPLFWPGTATDAGYVHRLAVAADAHGRGIGRALLRWAAERARARGTRALRLDTGADNHVLRRYYEDTGFELQDVRSVGRWYVALYEKRLVST